MKSEPSLITKIKYCLNKCSKYLVTTCNVLSDEVPRAARAARRRRRRAVINSPAMRRCRPSDLYQRPPPLTPHCHSPSVRWKHCTLASSPAPAGRGRMKPPCNNRYYKTVFHTYRICISDHFLIFCLIRASVTHKICLTA